jgi:hypothetical protein
MAKLEKKANLSKNFINLKKWQIFSKMAKNKDFKKY